MGNNYEGVGCYLTRLGLGLTSSCHDFGGGCAARLSCDNARAKNPQGGWRMAEGLHEIRDEKPIDVPFIWEPLVTFSRPAANGIYLKTGFA
jgi:hypothetical protein